MDNPSWALIAALDGHITIQYRHDKRSSRCLTIQKNAAQCSELSDLPDGVPVFDLRIASQEAYRAAGALLYSHACHKLTNTEFIRAMRSSDVPERSNNVD